MPVVSCDPLRVWSRLEPRQRQVELDRVLQARIEDPLWMLTRQWQFGEFHGQDTGSAVLATLAARLSPVVATRVGNGPGEPYDASTPLEARVERLPVDFPAPVRAQLGRHLLTLLAARLTSPQDLPAYRGALTELYPLEPATADPTDVIGQARQRTAGLGGRVRAALAGRAFDGVRMAEALTPGMTFADLPAGLAAVVSPGDAGRLVAALEEFRAWFDALYAQPSAARPAGWDGAKLEYDHGVTVNRATGDGLALAGAPTPSGRLDWYCFDVQGAATTPAGAPAPAWDLTGVIPGQVQFAGMPNARWWQLEDGAVSLGHLRADATDLAKIIVTEFALLYGNDWLAVPYVQPVGTLAELAGIVVTDVFGHRTLVRAATGSAGADWSAWDLFSLSPRRPGVTPLGQHLFLPPTLPSAGEGPALEEVAFVRDESANMVWAIETRIPDGLGGGRDGGDAARRLTAALDGTEPEPATGASGTGNGLRYVLATTVPENWIPFVPVHTGQDNHSVRLQRAWMPRLTPPSRVRPVTSILRDNLTEDDQQTAPYYVNEEEVPRAGIRVRGAMQRARWTDGSTVVWHGRRAVAGRGEGGSGLRFDVLES